MASRRHLVASILGPALLGAAAPVAAAPVEAALHPPIALGKRAPTALERRQPWRLRELRNFRDAGAFAGLPAGRLYRSDDPRHRPFGSCERLRAAGIRTIVKLNAFQRQLDRRRRPFWRRGACGLPELAVSIPYERTRGALGANIYSFGRRDGVPPARARVIRYIEQQVALTLRELTRLKPTQLPVLFHCSLGRDRTGILLAVIERLAGASWSGVERDYLGSDGRVGRTSVVSLRKVMKRLGPLTAFLRRELGLTWWEIHQLRRLARGLAATGEAAPRKRPVPFGPP